MSNSLRLQMARASLRYTPTTFSTPDHYCLAIICSRTSLRLSLYIFWPLMERGFWDCTAREKGSCMQGASQAVGCEHHKCGTGGWMGDVGLLAEFKPGRKLSGMGCEQGGLCEGTRYPLSPNRKILNPTLQASGNCLVQRAAWMQN